MIRLAIYDFETQYKPGRENVLADMLSRKFSEDQVNENREDYFDILIAAIDSETSTEEEIEDY